MTSQTIDGVPREVLEKALRIAESVRFPTDNHEASLRSLLDAPMPAHAEIEDEPGEALSIYYDAMEACAEVERDGAPGDVIREMNDELATLRAAQPQGEPRQPIYQAQFLGDGGGGWADVEYSQYKVYSECQHIVTRIVYE